MIFVTIALLQRKGDCGFEGKAIASCAINAPSEEAARRSMIAHTDLVQSVLDGWQLGRIDAREITPDELLGDDNLIKAFVIEMAKPKEGDDGS